MTRRQLEHILRAVSAVTEETEIVVLGSQAILGFSPDVPKELLVSMEADVFPLKAVEKADIIDGTIGELSPFHEAYGYYAHGIAPESSVLADGWMERALRIQSPAMRGTVGICLSPADLAVSKLAAGREKDMAFVTAMLRHRLVHPSDVEMLADRMPPAARGRVLDGLRLCLARA